MSTATTLALGREDLRLAQDACAQVAARVQGTVSVGLPGLVTGLPEPRPFIEQQFRTTTDLAYVLHAVSGKPEGQEELLRLRDCSRTVLTTLDNLRYCLLNLLDSSAPHPAGFQAAREAALALYAALDEYAALVELDRTRIAGMRAIVLQVLEGVEDMSRPGSGGP